MAAYSYEYAVPGLVKAPAQAVGELFEQLQHSEGGLTPARVLNESREEGSLLHDEFEWDNEKAAEKYRLKQARFLIDNIRVVTVSDDQSEREKLKDRAFVVTPGWKGSYVSLNKALNSAELREHLLKTARQDMEVFAAKYRRLEELASVIEAMESVMKQD